MTIDLTTELNKLFELPFLRKYIPDLSFTYDGSADNLRSCLWALFRKIETLVHKYPTEYLLHMRLGHFRNWLNRVSKIIEQKTATVYKVI